MTTTNEQQDTHACDECGGELDMHYLSCSVWAWNAAKRPLAAVSAAAPDERTVATVARAVLATPADWPGPDREQEWAEHIARAALAARPAPAVSGEWEYAVEYGTDTGPSVGSITTSQDRAERDASDWYDRTGHPARVLRRTVTAWTVADAPAADA